MNTEYEMTLTEQVAWQDSEYPVCDDCGGRIGIDCEGHEGEEVA